MLQLTVKYWSLCLLQIYIPNSVSGYEDFVDNANNILQRVGSAEPAIFL